MKFERIAVRVVLGGLEGEVAYLFLSRLATPAQVSGTENGKSIITKGHYACP